MSEYLTEITFPSFGISLNPSRGFFIGNFQIYWYAVLIASGLLLAVIYACRRCKTFGLRDNDLIDGVLCIVPFAVVCARAYYCVFRWEAFSDNPISVINIREGGLAIYGGVIGAVSGNTGDRRKVFFPW